MTKYRKLENKEFDELIEMYKKHMDDEPNRRTRKFTILWSSISIFYILGDLHLNVADTGNEEKGNAIAWGIPITGITEDKLLIFLLIMSLYFLAKFVFSIIKLHRQLIITQLFDHFWSLRKDEFTKGSHTDSQGSYLAFQRNETTKEKNRPFPRIVGSEIDLSISENKNKFDTWLFMYHYSVVGLLEYFFAPVIFPAILGICAIVTLAVELIC